jgi:hypothetical protein
MADIVKVPGIKKPLPKMAVVAGVAGVGVAIVLYYRSKKSPAAAGGAAAATATDQYPPDGTTGDPSDPYSTDPATGQTYGDETVGSGGTLGAFGADAASGMYYDPATGAYDLTSPYGTTPSGSAGGPPFATNQAWAAYAESVLSDTSPGALAAALGLYLDGQPVSAAQKTLIFQARGVAGEVPVPGPGNYPPNVRLDGGTGGKTIAVNPVKGLKATARYTQADLTWDKTEHAVSYLVTVSPGGQQHKTSAAAITLHGLKEGTQYSARVRAQPGGTGGTDAQVSFRTKTSGKPKPDAGGPSKKK